MSRHGWRWAGHRGLVWLGALLIALAYLAIVTNGFTARPDWMGAWNAAKLEAIR